jgi:aminopeptidase-like protein
MPEAATHPVIAAPIGVGAEMVELMRVLYPLCRSLTGDGVRETLRIVDEIVPLEVTEVPSGTQIFDWTVPKEWNISDAWVAGRDGHRIIDFRDSNLHVVGYSTPVRNRMLGAELLEHVHTHPARPDWIPARTAYWAETWGFCATQAQRSAIRPDEEYDVCIDSHLEPGSLTYGEAVIPGTSEQEMLLSTYVCHPSLCNDNLSGIAVLAFAGRELRARANLRYNYRLLFSPGTVGPLAWLSRNQHRLHRVAHGIVVACVGDRGKVTYKRSRRSSAEVDRAAAHVLRHTRPDAVVEDFVPWGGDERQFCSPGFDLPAGALTRSAHATFPEYHSSADNFELVVPESLADSLDALLAIIDALERNRVYVSRNLYGEPQLGRRGLYRQIAGGRADDEAFERALLWVLNLVDGRHSLLDVAERADLPFDVIARATDALLDVELIEEVVQ